MTGPPPVRFVVARYGAGVVGGAESLTRALALRMSARGQAVEVVTTCALEAATWANALPPGTTHDDGVRVVRHRVRAARRPWAFAQASRVMLRLPRPLRPERAWVAAQGPWSPSLVDALRAGAGPPTVFVTYLYHPTLRGLPAYPGVRLLLPTAHDEPALRLRAVGRMLAACDGIWYATPEERALVERVHPAARSIPAAVGVTGVAPPSATGPDPLRRRLGIEGPYLLYGGRATPGKGLDDLLDGAARLRSTRPEVTLVLAGDAAEHTAPRDGLVLAGRLPDDDWHAALAGALAVVVPSSLESLSLLALEAWAGGRPVLVNAASDVLAGQVARSGGGLAYRGPTGFVEAVTRLLDDPVSADAMGAAGRRHVEAEYRWDAVIDRFDDLLARAGAHARSRGR